jgi:hypothetical protein
MITILNTFWYITSFGLIKSGQQQKSFDLILSFSIFSLIAVSRDIVSITFSTNFLSCSNATVPLVSVINDLGIFQVTGLIIGFQSTIFFIAYQIDILCGSQAQYH